MSLYGITLMSKGITQKGQPFGIMLWVKGAQNEELHHPNYSDNPMLSSMGLYRRFTGMEGLTMENYNPLIAYHAKQELRGWNEVCRHPADWSGWNTADKSMIEHLLQTGEWVVTIGHSMYQVVK
jgi:hypothetical protein